VTKPLGDLTVRHLSSAQMRALALLEVVPEPGSSSEHLSTLASELARLFEATTFFSERSSVGWRNVAAHVWDRPIPLPDEEWLPPGEVPRSGRRIRALSTAAGGRWTSVAVHLGSARRAALVLSGDWRSSSAALASLASKISSAFRRVQSSATRKRSGYRLARRLATVRGIKPVCEVIVAEMARCVDARLAAIAVVDSRERRLAIQATYGYPLALVEHLSINAGVGVIGRVYESGRALHVTDAAGLPPNQPRRSRYRTDSFLAVPIGTKRDVLAVVCVADRLDDQPFAASELSVLRVLAAPAALALARERAVGHAEAFAHAAAIDPVSGLFNRRYFHIRIDEELQRSRRHDIPVALLMMDLDDFKAINDSYGHLVGDAIIKETAEILRRSVRVFDVCTRFGGEEFAIIMPGSGADDATRVAERIRNRIEAYRSPYPHLPDLAMTISIGLAISTGRITASELTAQSDEALYLAKRAGKNCVRVFGSQA
jgi:diguanylate cyclase (GGDEF)-like protein